MISRLGKWLASTSHATQPGRSRQWLGRRAYSAGVWFHTLQARKACYRADCIIQALWSGGTVEDGVARSKRMFFRQED